jgi:hypothetical protein
MKHGTNINMEDFMKKYKVKTISFLMAIFMTLTIFVGALPVNAFNNGKNQNNFIDDSTYKLSDVNDEFDLNSDSNFIPGNELLILSDAFFKGEITDKDSKIIPIFYKYISRCTILHNLLHRQCYCKIVR